MLVGPIARVVGTRATIDRASGRSRSRAPRTTAAAQPGIRPAPVTNEDYAGLLAVFENGVQGTFESSRTMVGPESQMAFDVYGTKGALSWNLERLNELQVYLPATKPHTGYTTVFGGDRFPYHGNFVPGSANGIGFEDVITIEDYEFLNAVAARRAARARLRRGLDYVAVQAALIRSWESGQLGGRRPRRPGGDPMKTVRLTTAQAIVRFLIAQRTVIDGARGAALPGRVRDLRARQRHLPRVRARRGAGRAADDARPERAGHGARRGRPTPRRCGGGRSWSPRRRSGRARRTWSRRRASRMANRLPLLLLSGDTFQSRIPDPVLQQVEHFGDAVDDRQRRVPRR